MTKHPPGAVSLEPSDPFNQQLIENVHPPDWINPKPAEKYDLAVIGAGTAGLVAAAAAAGLGARVALIERHLMGGDCLNVGCVPSKCLIAAGRTANDVRAANWQGVYADNIRADFPFAMERMRRVRSEIAPHDSAARFRDMGVDVFFGQASFADRQTIAVNGDAIRFKKAAVCAGARASIPPVEGLAEAGCLTNETVFSLTELPSRLAVIGAGPIGCELAQAFRSFGSMVHIIEIAPQFLIREDPDAAALLQDAFVNEGIWIHLNAKPVRVVKTAWGREIVIEKESGTETLTVDEILVGAGRKPNTEGLNLEAAGVEYGPKGITVNDNLRTTNPKIYAAGDICMDHKFTHAADFAARVVVQNALFRKRAKLSQLQIPWCTYTHPEIAHIGLYERDAKSKGIEIDTYKKRFAEVDRARAEGETGGFVKIHTLKGKDAIVGATIAGRGAGDLIGEIALAMKHKIGLGSIANVIHPYPTRAEAIRQLGDAYNRTRLTPAVKRFLKMMIKWA